MEVFTSNCLITLADFAVHEIVCLHAEAYLPNNSLRILQSSQPVQYLTSFKSEDLAFDHRHHRQFILYYIT